MCCQISPEILRQRLKVWSMRFKVFKEIYRQHRILWRVGMKSTSIRFKVSVLMEVLLRRNQPLAQLPNQLSVIWHRLRVTLNCFDLQSIQCRMQHQICMQFRVRHQRVFRKLQWLYPILLLQQNIYHLEVQKVQWQSLIMEDRKRENPRQLLLTNGLKQQNSEGGKLVSQAKSLILRIIPEPLCYVLVKLRMLIVLTISSPQHLCNWRPNSGLRESWFQDCKRT